MARLELTTGHEPDTGWLLLALGGTLDQPRIQCAIELVVLLVVQLSGTPVGRVQDSGKVERRSLAVLVSSQLLEHIAPPDRLRNCPETSVATIP